MRHLQHAGRAHRSRSDRGRAAQCRAAGRLVRRRAARRRSSSATPSAPSRPRRRSPRGSASRRSLYDPRDTPALIAGVMTEPRPGADRRPQQHRARHRRRPRRRPPGPVVHEDFGDIWRYRAAATRSRPSGGQMASAEAAERPLPGRFRGRRRRRSIRACGSAPCRSAISIRSPRRRAGLRAAVAGQLEPLEIEPALPALRAGEEAMAERRPGRSPPSPIIVIGSVISSSRSLGPLQRSSSISRARLAVRRWPHRSRPRPCGGRCRACCQRISHVAGRRAAPGCPRPHSAMRHGAVEPARPREATSVQGNEPAMISNDHADADEGHVDAGIVGDAGADAERSCRCRDRSDARGSFDPPVVLRSSIPSLAGRGAIRRHPDSRRS